MIDWKKKISANDLEIDMQGLPYYHLKFGRRSKIENIYGYNVFIPEEPDDDKCVNWGLNEWDQIFRKTFIPPQVLNNENFHSRDKWTEAEIDAFVDAEWNKRKNGVWFWIKGKKTYIPGSLYFKMNYWTPITDEDFLYRDTDREFFMFWLDSVLDPLTLGVADYKCRQLGDTENALVIMYERGSRIRGGLNTMQSCIGETHVKGAYERLIHGHKNMVYFFKPLNTGTENPTTGLVLDYPAKHLTHAEIERQKKQGNKVNKSSVESYQYPPVGSKFKYGPAKVTRFDGSTGVLTAYCDEFGKPLEMNPVEWVSTMAEAVFSNIRGIKRGMMLLTSTVEDITVDGLDQARTIYRESDPDKKLKTGSTVNRLRRIFRGAPDRGFETIVGDRWGFIDKAKVIEAITEKYNAMIAAGNAKGAMSFLRKNPRTIDDVFLSAQNESQFHVENLQKRDHYLTEEAHPKPWVRGNFKWQDGLKHTGVVIWEPNPNGRWIVSKHPHDYGLQNNARVKTLFSPKPDNTFYFCAGVDPIDQSDTLDSEPSKGAICVMRRPDPNVDDDPNLYYQFNDDIRGIKKGMPVNLGENFLTNRVMCTYMERPQNTEEFFEDVMLTMIYYGTDFLPEKNKFGGLHQYMKTHDYELYLMDKPTSVKNAKGQSEKDGVTATENSINMYFDFITTYTCNMTNAIDHPDLVLQLLTMNWKNKTKRDLGVAFGWCLYASMQQVSRRRAETSESKIIHFTKNTV